MRGTRWRWCSAVPLCLGTTERKNAWSQILSNHTFQRNQCSLSSHGNNMSALTDRAWHENRRGRYCHSAIVLFNQTFQQRHIVAPGFRDNTSLIRRSSAASTSWQKATTHFHLYIPPPLPALLFEFRPGRWCKRRRPSFLLSESDAPFVSKDRVSAHRGLWCS